MKPGSTTAFIASRLRFGNKEAFSHIVIGIARGSIALGVAVLVISVLIYSGFMAEIQRKIFSISGHLSLRQFTAGSLYEEQPIRENQDFLKQLKKSGLVSHVQGFSFKPALLKSEKEVEGIVLKGIGNDFNFRAFSANTHGPVEKAPDENDLWMSRQMATRLQVKEGSTLFLFFLQNPPRYRKMKVAHLYRSGLEEVDKSLVFVNRSLIQEMNEWKADQVGGFEIFIPDFNHFEETLEKIEPQIPYNLAIEPITLTQSQLFDWLNVIGRNVLVMFILISLVSGFNMAATLLIMVMERRQMVGILKALGATNQFIRQIFLQNGIRIIIQGLIAGNVIGLGLGWLQYQFHLIPLSEENYYMAHVPIAWDWLSIVGINIGVLLITALVLFIPVRIVNRIQIREAVLSA